jgi:hypothetical protein
LHIVEIAVVRSSGAGWMGRRLCAVWSANPGPQELPDLLGGLGCLGGTKQELISVRQALAELQGDVEPRLRLLLWPGVRNR